MIALACFVSFCWGACLACLFFVREFQELAARSHERDRQLRELTEEAEHLSNVYNELTREVTIWREMRDGVNVATHESVH